MCAVLLGLAAALMPARLGAENHLARLDDSQVLYMREFFRLGATIRWLASYYGVAETTASNVVHGKTYWEVGGYIAEAKHYDHAV